MTVSQVIMVKFVCLYLPLLWVQTVGCTGLIEQLQAAVRLYIGLFTSFEEPPVMGGMSIYHRGPHVLYSG